MTAEVGLTQAGPVSKIRVRSDCALRPGGEKTV